MRSRLHRLTRSFATEATTKRLSLSLAFIKDTVVEQVNLSTTEGDLGVLAGHVPSILQLEPGLIDVFEGAGRKSFFVSGGFALINPDSSMEISAMEVVPVEHLDSKLVADGLAEAQKRVNSNPTDELEKAESQIHHKVYQAMNIALSKASQ